MKRTSIVNYVIVTSIADSSTLLIGDSAKITSHTRALAVQRKVAVFFTNEGEFEDYPSFIKELPQPILPHERVHMNIIQESPYIRVNRVDIIGVAAASAMQIGSTCLIDSNTRIKHFRQFVNFGNTSMEGSEQLTSTSQGEV